ncbi:Anaphase-promoting complex subunit [Quillaja saponaria]|uniref:Anaphase-promoting complex subunit n=1 Tax=Quillaja saponaria TaxID=32244 RepID=A0AAD7LF08_QUISA|nr:Anaphase-promoting complex subunit [Quillaja saponaria]
MLQFPAYLTQYPWSTRTIPSSLLLPSQWPQPHNEELLLAMEESDFEEKCNEIRKTNSNLVVIGKTSVDNDKEDFDNDADDDDADNAEESDGEEFEQETG